MNEHWDRYLTEVDEKPASIEVNMGLVENTPFRSHPYIGYARILICCPDENGFAPFREYQALKKMEEALEGALGLCEQAIYVGKCVTAGALDLFFYTVQRKNWRKKIAQIMRAFPGYCWESTIAHDPDWVIYEEFLYPAEKGVQSILYRRFLQEYQQRNSLGLPLMEHWLGFMCDRSRVDFCNEALAWGFTVEEFVASPATALMLAIKKTVTPEGRRPSQINTRASQHSAAPPCEQLQATTSRDTPMRTLIYDQAPEKPQEIPVYSPPSRGICFRVRLSRRDLPETMDQVALELTEMAGRYNGEYNGWGWKKTPFARSTEQEPRAI